MTVTRCGAALLAGLILLGFRASPVLDAQQQTTSSLSVAEFDKLHRELQPPADELWRSIPWQVSILAGREQAARDKKPIFVWVASGEPLGCG